MKQLNATQAVKRGRGYSERGGAEGQFIETRNGESGVSVRNPSGEPWDREPEMSSP